MSPQIVTGHRMVMAIHANEATLWDQFRYAGEPSEFSWVLPVNGEARLELASDAFFDEVERATTPTVTSPPVTYRCPIRGGGGGGSTPSTGAGCSCGFGASNASFDASASGNRDGGAMTEQDPVMVLSQSVVRPYATVTLRSTDANALTNWLRTNGYSVPPSAEPTIRYYNDLHMDFLALRLRPGAGIQSMQPIRIRYMGSRFLLPLRMVGIGVGDRVAITLWVFGAGRYEAGNFGNATIDPMQLVWDFSARRSEYGALFDQTLASTARGRAWITEFADAHSIAYSRRMPDPDAGIPGPDGGVATSELDWGIATNGFDRNVWITRMRTNLLAEYLDADLALQASLQNTPVGTSLRARRYRGSAPPAPCPGGFASVDGTPVALAPSHRRRAPAPTVVAVALSVPAIALLRRRTRRRRS